MASHYPVSENKRKPGTYAPSMSFAPPHAVGRTASLPELAPSPRKWPLGMFDLSWCPFFRQNSRKDSFVPPGCFTPEMTPGPARLNLAQISAMKNEGSIEHHLFQWSSCVWCGQHAQTGRGGAVDRSVGGIILVFESLDSQWREEYFHNTSEMKKRGL